MSLEPDLVADLHLSDLAAEPLWPSAMVAGAAHYADAEPQTLRSPIDGQALGRFAPATAGLVKHAAEAAHGAFLKWRSVPASQRAELVSRLAAEIRQYRPALARLLTLETGQTGAEAEAELDDCLAACDYAQSLARQLHGHIGSAGQAGQRAIQQWQPLGAVAVISPASAPLAACCWHLLPALVCGDTVVWKPSEHAPLCAIALQRLLERNMAAMGERVPAYLCQLLLGGAATGALLASHPLLSLVAAHATPEACSALAQISAQRLGRSLLSADGSNAAIVSAAADLTLAIPAIVAATIERAGQAQGSLRRLIVHESVIDTVCGLLSQAFAGLHAADPRQDGCRLGPLIDAEAYWAVQQVLQAAEQAGAQCLHGGKRQEAGLPADAYYMQPALLRLPGHLPISLASCRGPLLYVLPYAELADAIEICHAAGAGPCASLFSSRLDEVEHFLGASGCRCPLSHINLGSSTRLPGMAAGAGEAGLHDWQPYLRRSSHLLAAGQPA